MQCACFTLIKSIDIDIKKASSAVEGAFAIKKRDYFAFSLMALSSSTENV